MSDKGKIRRTVSSFLKRTHQMLSDQNDSGVLRWASNGIGFQVIHEDRFAQEILPKYFKHNNYSSFVRQLNMYNFHKIRQHNIDNYFYHPHFNRQDSEQLALIQRKPEKKKKKGEPFVQEESHTQQSSLDLINQVQTQKSIKKEQKTVEKDKIQIQVVVPKERQSQGQKESLEERVAVPLVEMGGELVVPRLATWELMYPSSNNIFPFGDGKGQASTFCLFY